MMCETCAHYIYDEESDSYYCAVNLDEDELASMAGRPKKECPYYRVDDDEYETVRHQM